MIKLNATAGTYTAGSTIPITKEFNSNPKFSLNNNTVYIREAGFVETLGGINITSTAVGNYGINIVENGNVIASYYADSSVIGDTITIPLYELFRVIPTSIINGFANVSFTAVNDITVKGGIITLKYIE